MANKKQINDRKKRIKKNKILLEEKANRYTKKEMSIKMLLVFIASSLGVGLYYFLLYTVSNENTIVENIGMLIEGALFLAASIYFVSIVKDMYRSTLKGFVVSFLLILLMYYLSQLFSVFLLITLNDEYISYMAVNEYSTLFILKNTLLNLHQNFITMLSISSLNSLFNVVYSSFYIASFLSPILLLIKKLEK